MKIIQFLIFFVAIGFGCKQQSSYTRATEPTELDSIKIYIDRLRTQYSYIKQEGWEEKMPNTGDMSYIHLERTSGDTLEVLGFFKVKKSSELRFDVYLKEITQGRLKYVLEMKTDTLYHYKVDTTTTEKDFIVGKYNYNYENGLLKPEEIDYYLLYKDSLSEVRGNNILPLRMLNPEEKKQLDKVR